LKEFADTSFSMVFDQLYFIHIIQINPLLDYLQDISSLSILLKI